MSVFSEGYSYIVVEDGLSQEWNNEHKIMLRSIITVGDLINPTGTKSRWLKVVKVVYCGEETILYTTSIHNKFEGKYKIRRRTPFLKKWKSFKIILS